MRELFDKAFAVLVNALGKILQFIAIIAPPILVALLVITAPIWIIPYFIIRTIKEREKS